MKKVILILLLIMILFFTESMVANANEHVFAAGGIGVGDSPGTERDTKGILNAVSPSIVKVIAQSRKLYFASGIAIDRRHVISSALLTRYPYRRMYIKTVNKKIYIAKLVGKDPNSSLILLKINRDALTPIKPAASYEVGDWTALVGGVYRTFPAMFQGIVSSVSDEDLILNAPVMPGAAGGAAIDGNGRVIGVIRGPIGFAFGPDYIYSDHSWEFLIQNPRVRYKDLCCAVPVKKVMRIADDLKKYGKVRRGWLGLKIESSTDGIVINQVIKMSPAEKAGIRKGDIILTIDGKTINKYPVVHKIVKALKPDQEVEIEVLRGKERKNLLAVAGEAKNKTFHWNIFTTPNMNANVDMETFEILEIPTPLPKVDNYIFRIAGSRALGVDLMELTPELAKAFKVKEGAGLMISKLQKDTAAEAAGLQVADIIVKAGKKAIRKNTDLRRVLGEIRDNESMDIVVYRGGNIKTFSVVPDKRGRFGLMMDQFLKQTGDMWNRIDEENRLQREAWEQRRQARQKTYGDYVRDAELMKRKTSENYFKAEIEKMRKRLEKMSKEIQQLKKQLKEKEKNNASTTTI